MTCQLAKEKEVVMGALQRAGNKGQALAQQCATYERNLTGSHSQSADGMYEPPASHDWIRFHD
jgi:hypothetical protein